MSSVRLAICADDWGLGAGVNDAIADLIERGRLSATSCLVDAPAFASGAGRLVELANRADVGLHLNFTESFGEAAPRYRLGAFIARAYAGLLDPAAIRDEVRRQLDRFEATCGFAPHHVDGHQHVQQLPVVREALLAELQRRAGATRPWLRVSRPPAGGLKAAVLGALGARPLARDAARLGFATNGRLLGVYGFDGTTGDYLERLKAWVAQAIDGDLLMAHPGSGSAGGDPIAAARRREYEVLGGDPFGRALAEAGVEIVRLSAT